MVQLPPPECSRLHHLEPHRRGAGHAGHVPHRAAVEIADPDTDRVAREKPTHQLSRMSLLVPVFTAVQKRVDSGLFEAEGDAAAVAIGEDVGDDEGRGGDSAPAVRLPCRPPSA